MVFRLVYDESETCAAIYQSPHFLSQSPNQLRGPSHKSDIEIFARSCSQPNSRFQRHIQRVELRIRLLVSPSCKWDTELILSSSPFRIGDHKAFAPDHCWFFFRQTAWHGTCSCSLQSERLRRLRNSARRRHPLHLSRQREVCKLDK
jgi:hypothetical protein